MVEPGALAVDGVHRAGAGVDGEDGLLQPCVEDQVEEFALLGVLFQNLAFFRVVELSGQHRAVGVHRDDATAQAGGHHGDRPALQVVGVQRVDGVAVLVEQLVRLLTDNLRTDVERFVGELPDVQRGEVDGVELHAVGRSRIVHHIVSGESLVASAKHHLVADEGIVVEIETGIAACASCQLDDAVPGVLVNPFVGHRLPARFHDWHFLCRQRRSCEQQHQSKIILHRDHVVFG